jgi:hypothetical protein
MIFCTVAANRILASAFRVLTWFVGPGLVRPKTHEKDAGLPDSKNPNKEDENCMLKAKLGDNTVPLGKERSSLAKNPSYVSFTVHRHSRTERENLQLNSRSDMVGFPSGSDRIAVGGSLRERKEKIYR